MKIRTFGACLLGVLTLLETPPLRAAAPDWLKSAARTQLPEYPDETDAVVLFNEQMTRVDKKGEIKTRYRRAYKILRPEGQSYGRVVVTFDNETRLTYLKGWSLPPGEKEYEVKEKDALESALFGGALYQDTRAKMIQIPASEPGHVIGYEYEQRGRPFVLQDTWRFGHRIPVRQAQYTLELPSGWEYESHWINHPEQEPQATDRHQWMWELKDISAVDLEPAMPAQMAVAGRLVVTFFPRSDTELEAKSHRSWEDVAQWYARLARPRLQTTPDIRQQVIELTSDAPSRIDQIKILANFVQKEIRYVAIEIGIGGYQPNAAQDILTNRYGDCKDKATLLRTMLEEIGIQSRYVLVNNQRGIVAPEVPSLHSFNHVILAVRLPDDIPPSNLYSVHEHEAEGQLVFFDPTDTLTPLGYLPPTLQSNLGLYVSDDGGELLKLPLLSPSVNRLLRRMSIVLEESGEIKGQVVEIGWGTTATARRQSLLAVPVAERQRVLEESLATDLGDFQLLGFEIQNLDDHTKNLITTYQFVARRYGKKAGELLLIRPRILGRKGSDILERGERTYPVEFPRTSMESDVVTMTLPVGYRVDELPTPVHAATEFGEYHSKIEIEDNVLRYQRRFELKDIRVPVEFLSELKKFFRMIATDERSQVVLKQTVP